MDKKKFESVKHFYEVLEGFIEEYNLYNNEYSINGNDTEPDFVQGTLCLENFWMSVNVYDLENIACLKNSLDEYDIEICNFDITIR